MNISKIIFIRLGIFILLFSILILPLGLNAEKKVEKMEKVTMNRSSGTMGAQIAFFIAVDKGFYQKEGLNLELFSMKSRIINAALVSVCQ